MPRAHRINNDRIAIHCPACGTAHAVNRTWIFNGDFDRPTFNPSLKTTYDGPDAGQNGAPPAVCHCIVTDGRIAFLADCTHKLAGQTVDIPEWDHEDV